MDWQLLHSTNAYGNDPDNIIDDDVFEQWLDQNPPPDILNPPVEVSLGFALDGVEVWGPASVEIWHEEEG